MTNDKILENVQALCERENAKLLYCIKFGSHLYGTNTENSDLDVKGVFLPSQKSLLLGNPKHHLSKTTGDDRSKNSKEDIDIELWSLHSWFANLKKGDTHALDLLYSFTNADCVVYGTFPFSVIFQDPKKFINIDAVYRVYQYAFGQAKKYGLKGSRVGVLKRIYFWLDTNWNYSDHTRDRLRKVKLANFLDSIVDDFGDESYCFVKTLNDIRSLVLLGRVHQEGISMAEFYERVKKQYDTYGERAKLAEQNLGVDWKACSHALRAIAEVTELLIDGQIKFPISNREEVLQVKLGEISWEETEKILLAHLECLEAAKTDQTEDFSWSDELVQGLILKCFEVDYEPFLRYRK